MTVVVDTSVAAKWFLKESGREQALKVLDTPARHAPDLIASFAWKKAIRGEVTGDQARFIGASIGRYFVVLHRTEALVDRAITIALRLRHPIHDCLYLACAERVGCSLIAADQRLLAAIDDTEFASLAAHVSAL